MDKTNEKKKVEGASEDTGEGDKSELAKETEQANAAAERMEQATEKLEAATAKARLGGVAEAGQQPVKKPEIDAEQYARNVIAGKLDNDKKD